jgi:hypothetical protein
MNSKKILIATFVCAALFIGAVLLNQGAKDNFVVNMQTVQAKP